MRRRKVFRAWGPGKVRPAAARRRWQKLVPLNSTSLPVTNVVSGPSREMPLLHDGSAADLPAVVEHYDRHLKLTLKPDQKKDLVEFLKSL